MGRNNENGIIMIPLYHAGRLWVQIINMYCILLVCRKNDVFIEIKSDLVDMKEIIFMKMVDILLSPCMFTSMKNGREDCDGDDISALVFSKNFTSYPPQVEWKE